MKAWLKIFISGMMTQISIDSLHQDLLGKERYLELVDFNWVSWKFTVPLALLFLVTALILLVQGEGEINKGK